MKRREEMIFGPMGDYLRLFREAAGISQTEMAKQLRITPQFVSNWERGMSGLPAVKIRPALELIGVSLDDYVDELMWNYRAYLCRALGVKA